MQDFVGVEQLSLECQKRLVLTQVTSVDGFTSDNLKITVNSKTVVISGSNIKITSFNKATGDFKAEGDFNKIVYEGKKIPFIKRVFK